MTPSPGHFAKPRRRRTRWLAGVTLPALAGAMLSSPPLSSSTARADELHLRDAPASVVGETLAVSDAGVTFRAGGSGSISPVATPGVDLSGRAPIPWDRVRDLTAAADPALAQAFNGRRGMAEALWRARARIERLDYALAEPLLEPLLPDALGRNDATALVIVEGVLRCRLARGARAAAVIPWLEADRMRRAGVDRAAYLQLPPVTDPRSGLCPQLPPLFVESPGVERLYADLLVYVPTDAPAMQRFTRLYTIAAGQALGVASDATTLALALDDVSAGVAGDAGTQLLADFVAAVHGVGPRRVDPTDAFDRWIEPSEPMRHWATFARGHAWLRSADAEADAQRAGLVDLLTLPAAHAAQEPYLAGFALRDAADALERLGRDAPARSLRDELLRAFPFHPLNLNNRATEVATAPAVETHPTRDADAALASAPPRRTVRHD